MNVGIDFAGVTLVGSDIDAVSKSANITVEDATAIFGTWTGTLTYTVELVTEEA